MKIVNGVLAALAVGFTALGIYAATNGKDAELVIWRFNEIFISDAALSIAPLLLVVMCTIALVRKIRNGEEKKWIVIAGLIIFGIPAILSGAHLLKHRSQYGLVQRIESPDGEHSLYYYNCKVVREFDKAETDGACLLRRTGFFKYEKIACISDFDENEIFWREYGARCLGHIIEYSSYGD